MNASPNTARQLRRTLKFGIVGIAALLLAILLLTSVRHIDPTQIGLRISKLGNNRGVANASVISGYTLVNPITTEITTYPGTQVSYTWTRSTHEQNCTLSPLLKFSDSSVPFCSWVLRVQV